MADKPKPTPEEVKKQKAEEEKQKAEEDKQKRPERIQKGSEAAVASALAVDATLHETIKPPSAKPETEIESPTWVKDVQAQQLANAQPDVGIDGAVPDVPGADMIDLPPTPTLGM